MSYEYIKNNWDSYDESVDISKQPDAIITKKKLDKMEAGIERASMSIEIGNITTDNDKASASITVDEFSHSRKINIAFPKSKSDSENASIDDNNSSENSTWSSSKIESLFDDLNQKISDLSYERIEIKTFSNNLGTVEKGNSYEIIDFNWSLNKIPTTLKFNGNEIDVTLSSLKYPTTINKNTSFVLEAIDERNYSSSKTTSVNFVNGIYYGKGSLYNIDEITSDFVLTLTKVLSSSYKKTFTVNTSVDEYIYFIYPTSLGTPSFYVGGFEGGFDSIGNFDFTNSYGYTESYTVYVSSNENLGNTTVEVK